MKDGLGWVRKVGEVGVLDGPPATPTIRRDNVEVSRPGRGSVCDGWTPRRTSSTGYSTGMGWVSVVKD